MGLLLKRDFGYVKYYATPILRLGVSIRDSLILYFMGALVG